MLKKLYKKFSLNNTPRERERERERVPQRLSFVNKKIN